jgi:hypothetical protein
MGWRRVLGLAGFAGVAATGVVIARAERRRRAYTSDEIRERLQARLAESPAAATTAAPPQIPGRPVLGRPLFGPGWLRRPPRRWRGRT